MSSNVNPTDDPYQDLDLGAEPFKPDTVGDTITIVVDEIRALLTKTGKSGVLIAGTEDDDYGTTREWIAWNLHNKAEVRRERPMYGDRLRIVYDGRDPEATNPELAARLFTLTILERAKAES